MADIFKASEITGADQKLNPPSEREYSTPTLGGEYPPIDRRGQASVRNLPSEHPRRGDR